MGSNTRDSAGHATTQLDQPTSPDGVVEARLGGSATVANCSVPTQIAALPG